MWPLGLISVIWSIILIANGNKMNQDEVITGKVGITNYASKMFLLIQCRNSDTRVYTPGLLLKYLNLNLLKIFDATHLSPHPMPQLVRPARLQEPSSSLTTRGPPLSPSHVSWPPSMYPAHKNILGMYWTSPDSLKKRSHRVLERMGTSTCLNSSDISLLDSMIIYRISD